VPITSIKVDTALRDRIAEISGEVGASTLAETLERLIEEHEVRSAVAAYEELRSDPAEWAEYQRELAEWDSVTGDSEGA
jgi:hypothetical protein